eukprot:11181879-Lingulodinium_polyedra.AAC.2
MAGQVPEYPEVPHAGNIEIVLDAGSQRQFLHHCISGEKQWLPPAPEAAWTAAFDDSGYCYIFSGSTVKWISGQAEDSILRKVCFKDGDEQIFIWDKDIGERTYLWELER